MAHPALAIKLSLRDGARLPAICAASGLRFTRDEQLFASGPEDVWVGKVFFTDEDPADNREFVASFYCPNLPLLIVGERIPEGIQDMIAVYLVYMPRLDCPP